MVVMTWALVVVRAVKQALDIVIFVVVVGGGGRINCVVGGQCWHRGH